MLFVDDEAPLANAARLGLERLGYRATICTDPAEALRYFAAAPASYDLVVTDLHMPVMTGIDVGDYVYAGYAASADGWLAIEAGLPLRQAREEMKPYEEFVAGIRNEVIRQTLRMYGQFLSCLEGATKGMSSFEDGAFTEEDCLAFFRKTGYLPGIAFFRILKQFAAFLSGQHEEALEQAREAARLRGRGQREQAELGKLRPARSVHAAGLRPRAPPGLDIARADEPLNGRAEQRLIVGQVEGHATALNRTGSAARPRNSMLGG